jgi:sugar lactone lactonase YvrE
LVLAASLVLALSGCGDDDGVAPVDSGVRDTGPADTGLREDTGPIPDSGPDGGPIPDAGSGTMVRIVANLNPAMFEFPEGIALAPDGTVFVGIAGAGVVVRFTSTGTRTAFGMVPPPGGTDGFMTGLAVDATGNVYAAVASLNPASAIVPGIYRIPAAGGMGTLWASGTPAGPGTMTFPNGLDFDAAGNLYVTDSNGKIFKIPAAGAIGTAMLWSEDPLLAPAMGMMHACGMRMTPFPIGANGIVVEGDRVIVAHTEDAKLVSIAIEPDGTAGAATMIAMDCAALSGADGLAAEADGSWLAVMQGTNGLARITEDGTITVLYSGAPLRGPASIDYGTFGGTTQAVITNSSFGDLFGGMPEMGLPALAAATL